MRRSPRSAAPAAARLMRGNGCRYNVLYGSQGFSSYGYQGGCTFATGSVQQALAVPEASRYLCAETDATRLYCEHDHSVSGICSAPSASDGFVRVVEVWTCGVLDFVPVLLFLGNTFGMCFVVLNLNGWWSALGPVSEPQWHPRSFFELNIWPPSAEWTGGRGLAVAAMYSLGSGSLIRSGITKSTSS